MHTYLSPDSKRNAKAIILSYQYGPEVLMNVKLVYILKARSLE